ncbi:DUF4349 domain-containing protein [Mycobacterium sp. PS03-16]|uniref:DUF4349 domain-containing protein n=1 Tax=Mycobacterium sp. PS03-16 TaxID=2559611 RepID=UPI0010739EE5|nr:DUF4349 domain-containing protein [Mycobacterium sp. PS03-16]TFV55257.1 DUF4349 domain-containing protein [Mycobacterium sp. PS03-16]
MTLRWRRVQVLAVSVIATVGVLTACAGNPEPSAPAGGGPAMETGVVAPVPQDAPPEAPTDKRDVVQTASVQLTVADPSAAADEAAVIVEDAGGRVDARTEDSGSQTGRASTSVVLRVPAAELDTVVRALKGLGKVELAQTTSEDVTAQRVDLDARMRALQTSVDRLLAIMRDARDPEALITAENALSQRQAELDSLRAQRDALGDRIALSTVDVTFTAERVGGPAPEYRGFVGQIERGWDALISAVGGAVMLFGLLLPWLAVVAVFVVVCYALTRWLGGRRTPRPVAPATVVEDTAEPPPPANP